jgi:hypothetical protein
MMEHNKVLYLLCISGRFRYNTSTEHWYWVNELGGHALPVNQDTAWWRALSDIYEYGIKDVDSLHTEA